MNKYTIPAEAMSALDALKCALTDLRGAYLYGSATLGGLQVDSDVDVLAISGAPLTGSERMTLTGRLLTASGRLGAGGARPLEVTVMSAAEALSPGHPPLRDYQYGEWLRDDIEQGRVPQPQRDADAAILLWQVRISSVTLLGAPPSDMIAPTPESDIRRAIGGALPSLMSYLKGDERNVLLTLARMLYTLRERGICAKDAAAEWAKAFLTPDGAALMELARLEYLGMEKHDWRALYPDAERTAQAMRALIVDELA